MLDAAASAAARDAGATLALEAEAGKYELERAIIKAARKGIIGSTGQVRKSARVGGNNWQKSTVSPSQLCARS